MAARRVAITGLGIISPLGLNLADSWKALREGRPAIGPTHIGQLLERQFEDSKRRRGPRLRPTEAFRGRQGRPTRPLRTIFRRSGPRGVSRFGYRTHAGAARAVGDRLRLGRGRTIVDRGRIRRPVGARTRARSSADNSQDDGQRRSQPYLDGSGPERSRVHRFDGVLLGQSRDGTGVPARARRLWRISPSLAARKRFSLSAC